MNPWERRADKGLRALGVRSVRGKILMFAVVATLVPSLATAWISYVQNRRAITEKIADNLGSASAQAAREVDLWLKERLYDLRVFASSYEVTENLERVHSRERGPPARTRLTDYLTSVRERFGDYQALVVRDASGEIVAPKLDQKSQAKSAPPIPREWVTELRGGRPVLGQVFLDEATGHAAMLASVPIYGVNSRFIGMLTATLNLRAIDALLATFSPRNSGRVYVITEGATLITGSEAGPAAPLRTRLAEPAAEALFGREAAVVEYTGFTGQDVVGVLRGVPSSRWSVIAEVPALEAFRQIRRLRNLTLGLLALLVLGLGSLAYFLGLLIVMPLDRLRRGAAKVAAGDLDVDLPVVSGGEVGYLTEVFNDMVARLREGRAALERLSVTDTLTGLFNRRHLTERLHEEIRRARRHDHRFSVLMADIDHFKEFNDSYGHQAGDQVLARLGEILREATREIDYAARYGGEEFLVLMPETELEGAVAVAERIRARLASEPIAGGRVTVSVGVAAFPAHGESPEGLIASADAALYAAKRAGRNRVVHAAKAQAGQSD